MARKYEDKEMPFLDHLDELRTRIIRSFVALIIGALLCLIFSDFLLKVMLWPTTRIDLPLDIQNLKVQGMFIVKLEIAFFGGIIVALPYILYQIWMFVAPGLYTKERAYVPRIITFGTVLFLTGVAFAFTIIFPFALNFFLGLAPEGVSNIIAIDFYFGFLIRLLLAFGVVFELPIVSYFLSKMGILTPEIMRKFRKHAIVVIFILAALFTPPDPFTQIMLGIPLVLLYELSILISKMVNRGRFEKEQKESE
jgi:sec-independent protein translocase protein TatC